MIVFIGNLQLCLLVSRMRFASELKEPLPIGKNPMSISGRQKNIRSAPVQMSLLVCEGNLWGISPIKRGRSQMKTQTVSKVFLVIITAVVFAMGSVSFAAQSSTQEKGTKDVKEKVTEAVQAIEKYSVKQRDEAVKKAKAALDDLDTRIDDLESRLDEKWGQLDQAARQKARTTLTALRKERNEVAEWYGGLKHSSGNAWEAVKKGFVKSYRKLGDTFDKARSEF